MTDAGLKAMRSTGLIVLLMFCAQKFASSHLVSSFIVNKELHSLSRDLEFFQKRVCGSS